MSRLLIGFLSAWLPCVAVAVTDAEAVSLVPQWDVGRTYKHQLNLSMHQSVFMRGMTKALPQIMTQDQETTVTVLNKKSDGTFEASFEVDSIKSEMKMGPMAVAFDSTQPVGQDAGNPMAMGMRTLLDADIRYTADATGKLLKVSGPATEGPQSMQAGMAMMAGEAYLRQMISQIVTQGLPAEPVKPGASWPYETEVPFPNAGTLKMKGRFTFVRSETKHSQPCAFVTLSGTLKLADDPLNQRNAKLVKVLDARGTVSTELWFATSIRQVLESTTKQNLSLKLLAPERQTPDGQTIPPQEIQSALKQQLSVKLRRLRGADAPKED